MSEPPSDDAPQRPRVSDERLRDVVKQVLSESQGCPICGGAEFSVRVDTLTVVPVTDDPDGTTHATVIEREGTRTTSSRAGIVAVPVVCGSCGFIAQFHYDTLLDR
jgi:hypothetical protein